MSDRRVFVLGACLLAVVVAGCGATPAAIPPPPAPPAVAACAYSFSKNDGSTAVVTASGATACTGLESGLARDGNPWGVFSGTPDGNPACTLYDDGGTLTVSQMDWQPDDTPVAPAICASEEAHGWTVG